MPDNVQNWLESIGFGEYVDAFVENAVDLGVLSHLDNEDLKDLGISKLGDRKKLLLAIEQREPKEDIPSSDAVSADVPSEIRNEAERRQLTVMFVDLVGSTALSGQLDPEEMRDAITTYQNTVAGVVTRFDGYVAKYMGDGVLCYFGWPRAHEDDAERAVRAGLAIIPALQGLEASNGEALTARTGIATGLVVVGDLIGEGAAQEEAVVGETPNLAARLQGLAEPSQIVVADSTRRLIGSTFDFIDLGQQELKGITEPTNVFSVSGERLAESRFSARQSQTLSSLVGRDQELALLKDRWSQASGGEGQMVLLTGEAGVGKSRITHGLIDALSGEDHVRVSYQCSPYHNDSALYPAIQHLSLAANFDANDTPTTKLDKLQELLLLGTSDTSIATPMLASLLGLGEVADARYGTLEYSPQQRRMLTLDALLDQLVGLAEKSPILFVIEDAHWIDPTTLELIELCLDRVESERVMMLVTARPTFEYGFGGHPIVTRLALNRLGRDQISDIVKHLTKGKTLPDELLELVVAKTDGVPLFIEEFTKTLLESKFLKEIEAGYVLIGTLQNLSVPTSLHDLLMARLDRQQSLKEVAQTAACIGREFDYATLNAISPMNDNDLNDSLEQLREAELLFRRGSPPDATYTFKHALVRDAAYESLLKSKRKQVHALIFGALETRRSEGIALDPTLLAIHATEAELTDQAVEYWQQAGHQAVGRSANIEAIANLSRGIEILVTLPASVERDQKELKLQTMLAGPMIATRGYGAVETGDVFSRAHELSEQVNDPALLFPVLYQQWVYDIIGSRTVDARNRAEQFLNLADQSQKTGPRLLGHRVLAVSLYCQGEFSRAQEEFDTALSLYRREEHQELAYRFGQDPKAACLTFLSSIKLFRGYPDQASQIADQAIKYSTEISHSNTLAYALLFGAIKVAYCRRDLAAHRSASESLMRLSSEQGLAMWLAYATVQNGWILSQLEPNEEAVRETLSGLDDLQTTRTTLDRAMAMAQLAEVYAATNQYDRGLSVVDQSLEWVNQTGERWYEAELHRLKGDLLYAARGLNSASDSIHHYQQAINIAQFQGAKYWELRAAKSQAKLWVDQGERQKAQDLLSAIYDWFTEGFETTDLKNAKALLDELA